MVRDLAGGPVSVANNTLLRDFAIRAVEAQPLSYLHAVLSGLALAMEWPQRPYPDAGTVYYLYGPLFGLIMVVGLGGVVRIRRRQGQSPRLAWSRRVGSMLPWVTAVVLLVFPIAVADFDYRYLLPVLPFACLAVGLAFASAKSPGTQEPALEQRDDLTSQVPGQVG